ncbi:MAG: D-xylose ABC transporter ATP-binding protein, partial [Spirochaetes bacterium]
MTKAVEIVKITKTFPGVKALSNVEMSVKTGEVHAIVGENGAGKSTLMKILGGVYRPDDGQILIHGKAVVIKDVSDSVECGISIIYQELNLMPELTVSENVFITELPKMKATGIVRRGELYRKTRALMERVNIELNPDSLVNDLSVSEKQMVEILKALSHDSSIIVMDEPTAALSNVEVSKLYSIIETLKARGKTIIYISHRLKEIFDIADRVTVLRDGSFVATKDIKSLTQDDIVRLMVGRSVENFYNRDHATFGDTVI